MATKYKYNMTIGEAAKLMNKSKKTIRRYLRNNKLDGIKKENENGQEQWFLNENKIRKRSTNYDQLNKDINQINENLKTLKNLTDKIENLKGKFNILLILNIISLISIICIIFAKFSFSF